VVTTTSATTTTNNKWQATKLSGSSKVQEESIALPWQRWLTVPGTHSYHRSVSDDRLDQGNHFQMTTYSK